MRGIMEKIQKCHGNTSDIAVTPVTVGNTSDNYHVKTLFIISWK